jgi:cytochrome P450
METLTSILYTIIFLPVLIFAFLAKQNYEKGKKQLGHIPGAMGTLISQSNPIHYLSLAFGLKEEPFLKFERLFNELNTGLIALWYPTQPYKAVFIRDADMAKDVFIDNRRDFVKPLEVYGILNIFGSNIVVSEGEEWKKHRYLCNPAFGEQNLHLVFKKTAENLQKAFNKWDRMGTSNGAEIHIFNDMTKLALAVISEAGFNKNFHLFGEDEKPTGDHKMAFAHAFDIVSDSLLWKLILPSFLLKFPIQKLNRIGTAFDEFDQYILEIINSKRGDVEQSGDDLLSLLLKANKSEEVSKALTDRELIGNTFMFLLAGHETTANTLAFALGLLALHPEIQQKLYEESNNVLTKPDPVYEDYKKLQYSLCVFKETLRLFPPVVSVPKKTATDTKIGGYSIPEQTIVQILIYSLHRNPKHWTNPLKFQPERFDSKISPPIVPGSYFPFSGGPRNCIGMYFAQVEATLALSMIINRYSVEVPPGVSEEQLMKCSYQVTLRPANGMKVILRRRK